MSLRTRKALEESLKNLLRKKQLSKITIKELSDECNISRMTFYYHFSDIYDLARYISEQESLKVESKSGGDVKKHFYNIFEMFYSDKEAIINIYRSLSRENAENYLKKMFNTVISNIVKSVETSNVDKEYLSFIESFCSYAVIGCVIDWMEKGLDEPAEELSEKLYNVIKGAVETAVKNFTDFKE